MSTELLQSDDAIRADIADLAEKRIHPGTVLREPLQINGLRVHTSQEIISHARELVSDDLRSFHSRVKCLIESNGHHPVKGADQDGTPRLTWPK